MKIEDLAILYKFFKLLIDDIDVKDYAKRLNISNEEAEKLFKKSKEVLCLE